MKSANLDRRKQQWIIATCSQTTDGVWLHDGEYTVLPAESAPATVAEALQAALARTRIGIPHPQDWTGHVKPLLDAAGVKTWSAYVRDTRAISVEQADDDIVLTPTVNRGAREGFGFLSEQAIHVPSTATHAEIGAAIEKALARCE
ncbi:hypothetical protein [Haliangium sp.]|uniref:hypothetical protein n=1 Tax=Haliangium sp. TaxID=2663208 RepID=UPI003D0E5E0D